MFGFRGESFLLLSGVSPVFLFTLSVVLDELARIVAELFRDGVADLSHPIDHWILSHSSLALSTQPALSS